MYTHCYETWFEKWSQVCCHVEKIDASHQGRNSVCECRMRVVFAVALLVSRKLLDAALTTNDTTSSWTQEGKQQSTTSTTCNTLNVRQSNDWDYFTERASSRHTPFQWLVIKPQKQTITLRQKKDMLLNCFLKTIQRMLPKASEQHVFMNKIFSPHSPKLKKALLKCVYMSHCYHHHDYRQ